MPLPIPFGRPLPQCEGSKLQPFPLGKASIKFERTLSDTESEGHAHVFQVVIKGRQYALKIFKFYDDNEATAPLSEEELARIPLNIVLAHSDPFFNECRAYGRLINAAVNGSIAARCYGYLAIPAKSEEDLREKFSVNDWKRPESEYERPVSQRQPFRAILKELLSDAVAIDEKLLTKMRKDLLKMRSLGIYPLDLRARNYKAGLLVDMSIALTKPHFLFEIRTPRNIGYLQREDLLKFQKIIDDSGVRTWQRTVRNREYCKKLRSAPDGREKRPHRRGQ